MFAKRSHKTLQTMLKPIHNVFNQLSR